MFGKNSGENVRIKYLINVFVFIYFVSDNNLHEAEKP